MTAYLPDTNQLSQFFNPVSRLRERVRLSHRTGHRFGTCVPTLCELAVFIAGSSKSVFRKPQASSVRRAMM